MYKVQIKGLIQGTKKLKDDSYAVGFKTKYGVVWASMTSIWKLWDQNPHLQQYMKDNCLDDVDLIGRYMYITEKEKIVESKGRIYKTPIL